MIATNGLSEEGNDKSQWLMCIILRKSCFDTYISGAGELSPVITNSTGSQPILKTKILEFSPTLITGLFQNIADKRYPEYANRRLAPKNLF